MQTWTSVDELFNSLNEQRVGYIILRNFEEIENGLLFSSTHPDIDFLVSNRKKFSNIIGAEPRFIKDDGIHYKLSISNTEVIIDVRSVGDGYYDPRWEKSMLRNRVLHDGGYYIPSKKDYYYSLVYHAILQKKGLSCEYLNRLTQMAGILGIKANSERDHLNILESFMKDNGYFYTYPYDIHVPFRKELVPSEMVKKSPSVRIRDARNKLLVCGSKIKHRIIMR